MGLSWTKKFGNFLTMTAATEALLQRKDDAIDITPKFGIKLKLAG